MKQPTRSTRILRSNAVRVEKWRRGFKDILRPSFCQAVNSLLQAGIIITEKSKDHGHPAQHTP